MRSLEDYRVIVSHRRPLRAEIEGLGAFLDSHLEDGADRSCWPQFVGMFTRQDMIDAQMSPSELSEKGGVTTVHILTKTPKGEPGEELAWGSAQCRFDENFSRKLGTTIALNRALEKLGGS